MDIKIVKNYIDADRLIKDGFICCGIDRNIKEKSKLVFFFKYSEELISKLKDYSKTKKF